MTPTAFDYGLGGWPPRGPNGFSWADGRLSFVPTDWAADRFPAPWVARPTADEWAERWAVADAVGVWDWPPEVGDPHVIDGLMFGLHLEVGGRAVRSRGQCHGPPDGFTENRKRFHRAVQALVGWSEALAG